LNVCPSYAEIPYPGSLAARLVGPRSASGLLFYWLGQAGFLIETGTCRLLIDPYLSDSLAAKYRGKPFSHERMMAPPITVATLPAVDVVLCTHHHTDHMDGESLQAIARRFPDARFVVPTARLDVARDRIGIEGRRLIGVDAGEQLDLCPGIRLSVLRAAHESLERDDAGRHVFLGYGIEANGVRVFHSGDTIPFEGQAAEIRAFGPDLALFPVNGRSQALRSAGIAGNFTVDEAVDIAVECEIPTVLAHHYGMFAFNTVPPEAIDAKAQDNRSAGRLHRARIGIEYRLGACRQ
jgi:L-ascorbate metabolism protein UlaG (beta-lactamase superfamily)